ncbi:MAG: M15 family metallopeptidase [Candidatus Eremiobacteraeota bacterium]|jgi:hypothetical protein|nr:M15 family metallopeptidase [Candidatus Eremiobacteraeota bacterium]
MFGPSLIPATDPRALTGGANLSGLPDLSGGGLALDRLSVVGAPSLSSLAAPSSLTGQFEQQLAQSQLVMQVMTLLLTLMQNRAGNQADASASTSSDSSGGTAPVGSSSSGGSQASGSNADFAKAGSGDGSTVQRMGKPIGAHIAKQFDAMVAAAKKDGVNITITSGFRSRAEQEKLYAAYKNGTGNLAAKPGTSNHESGDALDLGPPSAYAWLKQNAGQFGFKNKIASEPWHWSLTGN